MSDAMEMDATLPASVPPTKPQVLLSRANLLKMRRASSVPIDIKQEYRTGYVYDEGMLNHKHSTEEHPEQPDRIKRIFDIFQENGLITRMRKLPFLPVQRNRVMLVHSADLWEKVHNIAGEPVFGPWKVILRSKLFHSDDPAGNY
jgi:histone deacetylase 6